MSIAELKGPAFAYGNDINTDYIIAGKYKFQSIDMAAMAVHALEELDPDYYDKLQRAGGGFLVAGTNFGCGSSREQAPLVLLNAGTKAVLAKSFARIFFRNAINTGLPVVVCDTDQIATGDELNLDLRAGVVHNITKGVSLTFAPLPAVMTRLLEDGGLAAHIRKHGTFTFEEEEEA